MTGSCDFGQIVACVFIVLLNEILCARNGRGHHSLPMRGIERRSASLLDKNATAELRREREREVIKRVKKREGS